MDEVRKNNLPQIQDERLTDLSPKDLEDIQEYKNQGFPMIGRITESDIFRWFELYMSGKQYDEIAKITKHQRIPIIYTSYKQEWFEKRQKHYSELISNLSNRITTIKVNSIDTLATIMMALNKYYNNKFNAYLATNDNTIIDQLDTKLLSHFYKSTELIEKLTGNSDDSRDKPTSPLVNLNFLGGSVQVSDNNGIKPIEITDENAGDFLLALAGEKKSKK